MCAEACVDPQLFLSAAQRPSSWGVRCVPMITEDRFREVFNVVEKHLEDRYELPVVITDVPHPFTGDLDGAEIRVDYDLSAEESLFILAHLFGHTVQWNLSAADREIGRKVETNLPESRLAEIERYEPSRVRLQPAAPPRGRRARPRPVVLRLRQL
jgi:hypothetical protein